MRGDLIVAMNMGFTAYFDDGGHPDDQPMVLVAGFISSEDQWKHFNDEWTAFVKRNGIPDDVLHMADFEASKIEPYSKWSDFKKNDFLETAAFWVNLRTRTNYVVVVPMRNYLTVNQDYALEECMGAPYSLAARTVAELIIDWEENNNPDKLPLSTIFEDGTKHKGDLLGQFKRDKLRTPLFAKKEDVPALQPCDWLAWEIQYACKTGDGSRKSLKNLLHHKYEHQIWTHDSLLELCLGEGIPLRSSIPANTQLVFESEPKRIRRHTVTRAIRSTDLAATDLQHWLERFK